MRHPTDLDTWHPLSRKFAFLAKPKTRRNFIIVPAVILLISIALGFLAMDEMTAKDEPHLAPWDFFAGWALWGFLSYSFVVLMAGPLFSILARPEGYYGEDEWTGGIEADEQLEPTSLGQEELKPN